MNKEFKHVIKSIKKSFSILITILFMDITFWTIFYLGNYRFEYYQIIIEISCLYYFVCLVFRIFKTCKEENLKQDNEFLQENLLVIKEKNEKDRLELNDYFTTWVHQIKTPITALKLLIDSESNDTLRMKHELIHIENYTNNAINFVKLIDEERDMEFIEVNLNDVLLEVVKKYSVLFIRNRIDLSYQIEDTIIITDPQWISILCEQIISNAIKYSKNKQIKIYVKTQQQTKNKTLVIEDNGIGIKSEDLPKIFDKGYTGFNGRLNQKSTGVGLFIAKKIAKKINIKLEIDSTYNVGTKVYISLCENMGQNNNLY